MCITALTISTQTSNKFQGRYILEDLKVYPAGRTDPLPVFRMYGRIVYYASGEMCGVAAASFNNNTKPPSYDVFKAYAGKYTVIPPNRIIHSPAVGAKHTPAVPFIWLGDQERTYKFIGNNRVELTESNGRERAIATWIRDTRP